MAWETWDICISIVDNSHHTFRANFGNQGLEHISDTNIIRILVAIKLADGMVIGIQRLRNLIWIARGGRALVNYHLAII